MEKKRHFSLPVTFSITNTVETKDTRFLNVTIDVLHEGLNFNGSIFNKDVVDTNANTIKNTPILGYIKMEDGTGNPDDFQAHEYNLVINDETGQHEYVYAGHSFGVIPESCNPRWVTKVSSDGKTRDYFEVDGLLWTKFNKAIDIFKRDIVKGESMELDPNSIEGIENKDGTFTFTKFKFDGCCILSTTDMSIQPAMIDANVTANFSTTLAQEIKEKLNEYQSAVNLQKSEFSNKNITKEREQDLTKDEVLKKYNLTSDKLDFKIDDLSESELDEKLKDFTNKSVEEKSLSFSVTSGQKRDALRNALDSEVKRDDKGNIIAETNYYVVDFDDTYVYVERDKWDAEGNYDCTHGRYTYTFDDKTLTATITSDFEEMVLVWLTVAEKENLDKERGNYSKLESDFAKYKEEYKTSEKDVDELRTYKANKIKAEHKVEVEKVFANDAFSSIKDNTEFIELQKDVDNMSLDDIKNKCYTILGKATATQKTNFSKNPNSGEVHNHVATVVKIDNTPSKDSMPYGGLFEEYKDE